MALLEKGCFCCRLETCIKIQAFTLTIGAAVASAVIVVVLAVVSGRESQRKDEDDHSFIKGLKTGLAVLFVAMTVWVLIGVLVLFGVYKRKRMLLWPYIVASCVTLVSTLGLILYLASSIDTQIPSLVVLSIPLGACTVCLEEFRALQVYMLLHVISLYDKMGGEERQQTRL